MLKINIRLARGCIGDARSKAGLPALQTPDLFGYRSMAMRGTVLIPSAHDVSYSSRDEIRLDSNPEFDRCVETILVLTSG